MQSHPSVHSSGDRHLCCFYLQSFMNDVAISFCVNTFFHSFDVSRSAVAGHRLILSKFLSESLYSKGLMWCCPRLGWNTQVGRERHRMGFFSDLLRAPLCGQSETSGTSPSWTEIHSFTSETSISLQFPLSGATSICVTWVFSIVALGLAQRGPQWVYIDLWIIYSGIIQPHAVLVLHFCKQESQRAAARTFSTIINRGVK